MFKRAEMIVKVKEPQAIERAMLREGQILFTYLHLAPDPEQAAELLKSGAICIAYETVTSRPAGCRCWRRCRKWRAVCRCRRARVASRNPPAEWACCSAALPASRRDAS